MNRATWSISIALTAALSSACGHQDGASTAGASAESPAAAANEAAAAQAPASAAHADAAILDACALISQADAESILGVPAKLSEREKDDKHVSHCSYEAVDQNTGVNSLGVDIQTDENANDARDGLAIGRKLYSNTAGNIYLYEALSGIGDDAFLVTNKTLEGVPAEMAGMLQDLQMLFLIKGGKDIQMTATYTGKQRPTDSLKALAKKLADKI